MSLCIQNRCWLAWALVACCWSPTVVWGDLVKLKSGGELRGKVISDSQRASRELTVRTVTGALVTVDRDQVDFIARRSLPSEEYELRARLAADTAESQWELAEWCVSQRLIPQRERHLQRIIELDPDNEPARKALGYQRRGDQWSTHEEHMLSMGYVRYKGRYITPEEKQLLENSQGEREQQLAWYGKVRLWSNWLGGRNDSNRQQAVEQFKGLNDPNAIPALKNFLAEDPSRDVRIVYINTLRQMQHPDATTELVRLAVLDGDQGIRQRAIETIPTPHTGLATGELVQYLKHGDNPVVRRAGSAIKQLGSQQAVPHLIEALVTNHKYKVAVERPRVGVSLGPGGAVGPAAGGPILPPDLHAAIMAGIIPPESIVPPRTPAASIQWVTVRVDQQNPEVLEALREITQVNFGYDKRTWRLWLMSQNS